MSGALRSIRETCQPRPDVLIGGMSDSQFAAQLDKVVRDSGGGYEVYSEPDRFFELTYPTSGLRELLGRTSPSPSPSPSPRRLWPLSAARPCRCCVFLASGLDLALSGGTAGTSRTAEGGTPVRSWVDSPAPGGASEACSPVV